MMTKSGDRYCPKPHLLAFVDTLGFYKEIQKSSSKKIEDYLEVFERLKSNWAERNENKLKLAAIGDSVIIGVEVSAEMIDGKISINDQAKFKVSIYQLCFAVAELQYLLAIKDIWTRGAVTLGPVDFDSESGRLLGPAFHSAYKLESTVARFPRVILDGVIIRASGQETTHDFVREVNATYGDVTSTPVLYDYPTNQGPTTFLQDVPTFINFAAWASSQLGGSPLKVLAEHVSSRMKDEVEHYEKYRWLADYLINVIVSGPKKEGPDGVNLGVFLDLLQRG